MAILVHVRCPSCAGVVVPTELYCEACELTLRGRFAANEFAGLGEEDLHFLRIFVLTEGRIREMESALGVSYPTIKGRLAKLKETLAAQVARTEADKTSKADRILAGGAGRGAAEVAAGGTEADGAQNVPAAMILQELQAGRLTFDQAMARLKLLHEKEGEP